VWLLLPPLSPGCVPEDFLAACGESLEAGGLFTAGVLDHADTPLPSFVTAQKAACPQYTLLSVRRCRTDNLQTFAKTVPKDLGVCLGWPVVGCLDVPAPVTTKENSAVRQHNN